MLKPPRVKFHGVATDFRPATENEPRNTARVVTGLGTLPTKVPVQDETVFAAMLQEAKQTGTYVAVEVEGYVIGQTNATKINGDAIAFGRFQIDAVDCRPARPAAPGEEESPARRQRA